MATIGTLAVNLLAKTSVFDRKMKKSKGGVKGMAASIANAQRKMLGLAKGVLIAAGVGGLGFMIKRTMESIDVTAKLSDRLNIATEDLVAMQHAAKINGMDVAGMNKGLETFVRRLGEARMGLGQTIYALDALGLSADKMVTRDHIDNLKIIADKIKAIPNVADRATAAYFLFGRQGTAMLNLLIQGSEGISAMQQEAERLGITFSRLDAAKVEAANDAFTRAHAKIQGLVQVMTIQLAPHLEAMAEYFENAAVSTDKFSNSLNGTLRILSKMVGVVVNLGKLIFSALELLSSTAIAVTGAFVAMGGGKNLSTAMFQVGQNMQDKALKGIKDAMSGIWNVGDVDKWFDNIDSRAKQLQDKLGGSKPSSGGTGGQTDYFDKLSDKANRLKESLKSPLNKLKDIRREYKTMLDAGLLTNEQFNNGLRIAAKSLADVKATLGSDQMFDVGQALSVGADVSVRGLSAGIIDPMVQKQDRQILLLEETNRLLEQIEQGGIIA